VSEALGRRLEALRQPDCTTIMRRQRAS